MPARPHRVDVQLEPLHQLPQEGVQAGPQLCPEPEDEGRLPVCRDLRLRTRTVSCSVELRAARECGGEECSRCSTRRCREQWSVCPLERQLEATGACSPSLGGTTRVGEASAATASRPHPWRGGRRCWRSAAQHHGGERGEQQRPRAETSLGEAGGGRVRVARKEDRERTRPRLGRAAAEKTAERDWRVERRGGDQTASSSQRLLP